MLSKGKHSGEDPFLQQIIQFLPLGEMYNLSGQVLAVELLQFSISKQFSSNFFVQKATESDCNPRIYVSDEKIRTLQCNLVEYQSVLPSQCISARF